MELILLCHARRRADAAAAAAVARGIGVAFAQDADGQRLRAGLQRDLTR